MAENDREHDLTTFPDILGSLTNYIRNVQVASYNAGVDAERDRCLRVVKEHSGVHTTGMKGRTDNERQTAAGRLIAQSISNAISDPERGHG